MSKKFDYDQPWKNCNKRFCPHPYIFDKYRSLFTSRHIRVWRALYSFQNPENRTCYPVPAEVAARSGINLNRSYELIQYLIKLHIISREKGSKYYKYPNYKFLTENCSKADLKQLEQWLKALSNLPKEYVTKLTKMVGYDLPKWYVATYQNGKLVETTKPLLDTEQQQKTAELNKRSKLQQEEVNNNKTSSKLVVHSLSSQNQKQSTFYQNLWTEWGISVEKLRAFKLLEILLWTDYIQNRIENGYKVDSPGGYLFNCLKDEKRKLPNLEDKKQKLLDQWIPSVRIVDFIPGPKLENDTDYRKSFTADIAELEGRREGKNIQRLEEELNLSISEITKRAKKDEQIKKRLNYYLADDPVWKICFEEGWYERWREAKKKVEQLRSNAEGFFESLKEEVLK